MTGKVPTPTPTEPKKKSAVAHVITGTRRVLAVAAFVAVAAVVLVTYLVPNAAICRGAADAKGGVATLCGPVGLADVPALGVLLFIGVLLLLNDVSEVSIPGLITLKRAVEEQAKKTEALTAEISSLSLTLRQTTTVNVMYPPDPSAVKRDVEERDSKIESEGLRGVGEDHPINDSEETGVAAPSPDRAVTEAEVTRLWEALVSALPSLSPAQRRDLYIPSADQMAWLSLYGQDIEAFRALRNTVVHQPANLSDEQVRGGVELGRSLLASYRKFIERARGG